MSFFRYPGGKSKLQEQIQKKIAERLTDDIEYREPFFGGGSIGLQLLANKKTKNLWVNDKDIGIACLWTAVIKYQEDFKDRISEFEPSVQDFFDFRGELTTISSMPKQRAKIVDIGFKKLAIHQISYSGLGTKSGSPLGGIEQKSAYKINCRWSPAYICKKIDNLHKQLETIQIRDDGCSNLDFIELIEDDSCEGLLYLDPPYYEKGGDLYQHFFTREDHERLAAALKQTKQAWVLSYDDCKEIRELYNWASIECLTVNYSITATKTKDGKRESRTKTELLIT